MQAFDFLAHLPAVMPELGLTVMVLVLLAADIGFIGLIRPLPESRKHYIPFIGGVGLLVVALFPLIWAPAPDSAELVWGGMIRHDTLAQFFKVTVILAGALTCFMGSVVSDLSRKGEFYVIIVTSTLGASLLSASADLIMVFVALETVSIPLYILAGFNRDSDKSAESGMKYFLFGSFASAIMLYGFSLLYGFTGQTNLYFIADYLNSEVFVNNPVPVLAALVMVVAGFGFKVSAVPFHFWTPDVYEGAPTPVTAFISVASKAASFAVLIRFMLAVFPGEVTIGTVVIQDFWVAIVSAAAVMSMIVGNVLALSQRNIKRMLAYSSIAQAGYTLIGVAALQSGTEAGAAAVAFYMILYTFTNMLAFAVVAIFAEQTGSENIADLAGLSRRNPWLALAMTIALLSLAGIPPAAGFFGKAFLFISAVQAGLTWLAIIGVINAIVALWYYLIVIKIIYVDRSADEEIPVTVSPTFAGVLALSTIAVLILGVIPQFIFDWATIGASGLFL